MSIKGGANDANWWKIGFEGGNLLLHSGPADDCGLQNKGRANNESGKCKV